LRPDLDPRAAHVWDAKRQIIWFVGGIALGSFILYQDSFDDNHKFDARFFAFLELLLVLIMTVLFYLYSRQKR
jgi:cell division protein FtsW (lipid II flippase)